MNKKNTVISIFLGFLFLGGVTYASTISVPQGGTGIGQPGGFISGTIPIGNGLNPLATSTNLTFDVNTNTLSTQNLTITGICTGCNPSVNEFSTTSANYYIQNFSVPVNTSSTATSSFAGPTINANGDFLTMEEEVIVSTSTTNGQYTDIQQAINALPASGGKVFIRSGTYNVATTTAILINKSKVHIQGEAMGNPTIQCNGGNSWLCFGIATSSNLSQIEVENIKVLNTNAANVGVGFSFSDASNLYIHNVRAEGFATGTEQYDTSNTSFYSEFRDVVLFDNITGLDVEGSQPNDNAWFNLRVRPKLNGGGYGVYMDDSRNYNFYNADFEPSAISNTTGIYLDSLTRDNAFFGTWDEANLVGVADYGTNNQFHGGTISSNGTDIGNFGKQTTYIGTNKTGTKLFLSTINKVGFGTTSPYQAFSVAGPLAADVITGTSFTATSTTATSTFNGSVQIGPTTGNNAVTIFANRNYGTSQSVGGALNLNMGTFTGAGAVLWRDSGVGGGRLFSAFCNNTLYDAECGNFQSLSATQTTLNVQGNASGRGVIKVSPNGIGGANGSLLSLDASSDTGFAGYLGQAFFAKCGTTSYGCFTLRTSGNTDAFIVNNIGLVGIASSTQGAMLSMEASSTYPSIIVGNDGSNPQFTLSSSGASFSGSVKALSFLSPLGNLLLIGNGTNTAIRPDSSGGDMQIQSFAGGVNTTFLDIGGFVTNASSTVNGLLTVNSLNAFSSTATSTFNGNTNTLGTSTVAMIMFTSSSSPLMVIASTTGTQSQQNIPILSNVGSDNWFWGPGSGINLTTGTRNVSDGPLALRALTSGSSNTAVGRSTMFLLTTGSSNTAYGNATLANLTTGSSNVAIGDSAGTGSAGGLNLTGGNGNIFIGQSASGLLSTMSNSVALGNKALVGASDKIVFGSTDNTRVGIGSTSPYAVFSVQATSTATTTFALAPITNQTANILDVYAKGAAGAQALKDVITANNSWGLGSSTVGANAKLVVTGGGLWATNLGAFVTGDSAVCVTAGGEIHIDSGISSCIVSSRTVKHNILSVSVSDSIKRITALDPVSFLYNANNKADLGLIAEDVATVDARYAQYNLKTGKPSAINWSAITSDLVKTVQNIIARVTGLEGKVKTLEAQNTHLQAEIDEINKKLK